MSRLVAEATCLLAAYREEEEVPNERLDSLMQRIRLVASGLQPHELRALKDLTDQLEVAIRHQLEGIGRELRQTGANRRALRGYGHLRSHTRAQRVNCKT